MVQVHKDKVGKVDRPGIKTRTTKVTFGSRRKNAPIQVKKAKDEQKVTGAIHRNIEDIMTARIKHEGGHLRILKAPENVYEFAKGGARLSDKVLQQRSNQIGWRRTKIQDREKELKMDLNQEIRKQEKLKLKQLVKQREAEQRQILLKLKERKLQNKIDVETVELVDDDVAGDFFDDVIGNDFQPIETELKPEDVGAKNSKGSTLTSKQLERQKRSKLKPIAASKPIMTETTTKKGLGPVKRANIKGLHDEKAMELLDDKF